MTIRLISFAAMLMATALAQQTVAPTDEPVGKRRGDNWSDYNIVDSFETGYRFRSVGGDLDQYRSTINYSNGIRLLGSYLTINSKDGYGRFFDELALTTQGLGSDPYQNAALRIQKNRLYRYDLAWRLNDYYNPGLRTNGANGQHLLDTEYTLQDHDLTLFPQSNVKFFLGFTHANQNGPALSTVQLFDSLGNEFPLFENVRRVRNEYRVGNEFRLFGIRLNWLRGWEDFKEDSRYRSGPSAGNLPDSGTALSGFNRGEPYHGTSPYWRAALFAERRLFSFNGRFTYTAGRRAFVLDEAAFGAARFGGAANRQIVTSGNAQRPVATGNATVSFFPAGKLTVVNHTALYNIRIDGNSSFLQLDNATLSSQFLNFQFLGIRTVANEIDVNYQASQWLGFYGGYHYSNRLIRSMEQVVIENTPQGIASQQTNQLHSGVFGLRLKPLKPLTIVLDGEVGRADRPFTPVSDRSYHALGARLQYKLKAFHLSAYTRTNYNVNSVTLSSYSSHSRTYAADGAWTPRDWFSIDAGYSKLHLDSVGGIAYFADQQFIQGERSLYFSNLHAANLGARFNVGKRADFYAGYSHVQDTGDGRANPLGQAQGASLPALQAAQTFPVKYQSPLARFSLRITEKVRWTLGYQYYGYRELFFNRENFRAHTGYTSVLWSF